MKLNEFVELKKRDLLNNGMRTAEFRKAYDCQVGKHSVSFLLFGAKEQSLDTEVTEIDRSELPDGYGRDGMLDAIVVDFDVVKPRCRKSTTESFYVRVI